MLYLTPTLANFFVETYKGTTATWEEVSPTFSTSLSSLPPLLVECGECEVLFDQIMNFCGKCIAEGVEVELHVYDDMVHVFQLFSFTGMKQCGDSLESMGAFCRRRQATLAVPSCVEEAAAAETEEDCVDKGHGVL